MDKADLPKFAMAGFWLFANQVRALPHTHPPLTSAVPVQFGFIVGEKLANAVIGSAWQPTQPIFSTTIAILLGWEVATLPKVAGILVAFGGAAFMVFYGQVRWEGSRRTRGLAPAPP